MPLMGNILNIARGSLHDGGGVRTVVYFKGCPLRCKWCHNPETFTASPVIMYAASKCVHCGGCAAVCPECHSISDTGVIFNRDKCRQCGKCADICPTGAVSVCGMQMSADTVLGEIVKDIHYFRESGGGVTLSGGECLLQADFAAELLKLCCEREIHTAIESALYVPFENIEKVLPYVDLIYADLKHHDSEKHARYTGKPNEQIIENIGKLSHKFNNIIIRIPLIPGVNDSEDDMCEFAKLIDTFGDGIRGVELLKYNYLAKSKYESVGIGYADFGDETQSDSRLADLKRVIRENSGLRIPVL